MFDFLFFCTTQYCMLFLPYFLHGLNFFSVVGTTRTTRPTWRKCKLNRNFRSVLTSVFPPVRFLNVLSIRPSDCPFVRPPVQASIFELSLLLRKRLNHSTSHKASSSFKFQNLSTNRRVLTVTC